MERVDGSRVLVTGGAGFIGSHLVEALLEAGASEVRVFDDCSSGSRENLSSAKNPRLRWCEEADIKQPESVARAVEGADYVVHLAAAKHNPSAGNDRHLVETNINGTFNILEAAAQADVKRVLFASSLYVYGVESRGPFSEEDPLHNRTLYGATKIAGEQLCHAFYRQRGLPYVALRYFFVYGPRLYQKNYQYAFVAKTLDRIASGVPPEIYGDGRQGFDYIYIDDAVRGTMLALEEGQPGRVFNIGTGKRTNIGDLCRLILRLTGSGLEPTFGPADETFGTVRVGDCRRAEKELGFEANTPIDEGIQRVISWRDEQSLARAGSSPAENRD